MVIDMRVDDKNFLEIHDRVSKALSTLNMVRNDAMPMNVWTAIYEARGLLMQANYHINKEFEPERVTA